MSLLASKITPVHVVARKDELVQGYRMVAMPEVGMRVRFLARWQIRAV